MHQHASTTPSPSGLCSRLEHRPPVRLNPAMHWVHTLALPVAHVVQLATEQAAGPVVWGPRSTTPVSRRKHGMFAAQGMHEHARNSPLQQALLTWETQAPSQVESGHALGAHGGVAVDALGAVGDGTGCGAGRQGCGGRRSTATVSRRKGVSFVVTAGMDAMQGMHQHASTTPSPSGLCSRLEHRPPVRLNPAMHWVHTVALPVAHVVQLATEQAAGSVARVVGADGQRRRSAARWLCGDGRDGCDAEACTSTQATPPAGYAHAWNTGPPSG
jgi:hypothetical protein